MFLHYIVKRGIRILQNSAWNLTCWVPLLTAKKCMSQKSTITGQYFCKILHTCKLQDVVNVDITPHQCTSPTLRIMNIQIPVTSSVDLYLAFRGFYTESQFSVCLSVTRRYCVKTNKRRINPVFTGGWTFGSLVFGDIRFINTFPSDHP